MNIAIDVLGILSPGSKNRGIGNYTISQLKSIFEKDKENRYFLLNFYEDSNLQDILGYSDNVSEHFFYLGKDNFLSKNNKFKGIMKNLIVNFFKENEIDVFYMTSVFDGNFPYDMEWFSDVKTCTTLYDVIPYVFKERYLANKTMYKNYMVWINNVKKMDRLLAISQSAKDDMIKYFNVDSEKINVIYAGTDNCYKSLPISVSYRDEFKKIYDITNEFIMCTGGDDDRKNIEGLILAYSKMPKELINKYQLVIVCKLSQASEDRYYEIARNYNVRDRVILTNFVPLEHLILLYNLAHVVAFPSQYEGFGLPVVEAMACGTPVLTSNNSSLGEIAEGAAVLVDPFDVDDITRGLVEILVNSNLNDLKQKGYERVKKFTWEEVALSSLNVLNEFGGKIKELEINSERIAFFTPLPPIQSGISDYSVDIIKKLSKSFFIDVYIDKGYTPKCELPNNVNIYEHRHFLKNKSNYLEVVYQMGNSEYHSYMIEYIKLYPGILVLHDYNLHGLLHFKATKEGNLQKYREFLYEDYSKEVVDNYVEDFTSGKTTLRDFELPCNGTVTNYSKKVIVHSDYSKRLLLEKDISKNVRKIHHYAKIEKLVNKGEVRQVYNIDDNELIISAFGHIHETKRIMPILKAFKKLLSKFSNISLYLVGKPSPSIEAEINQYMVAKNLDSKVTITGYTDINEFERYMDISDICLNLRYPYNGETSGSLMRILAKGKCVLVSDIGSFSEVPDNCCIKLDSPENLSEEVEVDMIAEKLEMLILNPNHVSKIANNARRFAIDNLNIDSIAQQYAEFINQSVSTIVTESMLKKLSDFVVQNYGPDVDELYRLSKTIANSK